MSVYIPAVDEIDEDDMRGMVLVGRKLVLICVARGVIIWMGGVSGYDATLLTRDSTFSMSSSRRPCSGWSRSVCNVAATWATTQVIIFIDFEPSGSIQPVQTVEAAEVAWSEITGSGWDVRPDRSIAITSTDIVVVDILSQERRRFRSIISFYPRFAMEDISYQTLQLDGCQVLRMQALRDCHVILFCRVYADTIADLDPDLEDVNGHWFSELSQDSRVFAILLHVPTRIEVQRVLLTESPPFAFSTAGATVGVGLAWKGVIMTGTDVRDLGENYGLDGNKTLKLRRKKNIKSNRKRNPKGFSKQDGFARGMSMQG